MRRRSTGDLAIGLAFVAGTVVGAVATASVVALVSALLSTIPVTVRYGAAIALSLAVLAADRELFGWRLPQSHRQIPPTVVAARRPSSAWRFALVYGTGLFTFLPSAAPHIVVIWLALLDVPTLLILSAGAAFGLGRGLPLLARAVASDRQRLQARVERTAGATSVLAAPALLVLGAVVGWP